MQGWIEGFQKSIEFIENSLSQTLDIEDIAAKAALSSFYYQRIFGALCGMTLIIFLDLRSRKTADLTNSAVFHLRIIVSDILN